MFLCVCGQADGLEYDQEDDYAYLNDLQTQVYCEVKYYSRARKTTKTHEKKTNGIKKTHPKKQKQKFFCF